MKALIYDVNNKISAVNEILNFNFSSDLNSPANQLSITFKLNHFLIHQLTKIKLYYQDYKIFDGIIDEQIISRSSSMSIVKIAARSLACSLLDNQALPQMYHNISLKNILDQHILHYGFGYQETDPSLLSTSLKSFTVLPNMSEWAVLESFTRQSLNLMPFICENNIYFSNQFPDSFFSISNNKDTNIISSLKNFNYSYISANIKRLGLVSDILIKNSDNSFKHIVNDLAYKNQIKVKRYSSLPEKQINSQLKSQNNNVFSLSLSIPNLLPSKVGHKITVIDDIIESNVINNKFIIKKLYYTFKNNEVTSYLSLVTH